MSTHNFLEDFEQLPIWKAYKSKTFGTLNVDKDFSDKLSLLDRYYLRFPKYTLHNRQHQKNILRIIGELLGDDIDKLTSLELALIILVTVYHDIGMVFKDDDINEIQKEPTFEQFLQENLNAKLKFLEASSKVTENWLNGIADGCMQKEYGFSLRTIK